MRIKSLTAASANSISRPAPGETAGAEASATQGLLEIHEILSLRGPNIFVQFRFLSFLISNIFSSGFFSLGGGVFFFCTFFWFLSW